MMYVLCNNNIQTYNICAIITVIIIIYNSLSKQDYRRLVGMGCSAFPCVVAGRPDRPDAGGQPRAG